MDKLLEEFIKDWRLKNNSKDAIYSSYHYDAMIEFAKHYHSQQLILSGVSQQRELLAFRKWQKDNWKDVYLYSNEFMIREFKKANCG
jgi:hypothetical protein